MVLHTSGGRDGNHFGRVKTWGDGCEDDKGASRIEEKG